jgi:ABC-type glutathione transport system ATPase component
LRNPRLLIVDEPTENLDAATAARLLAALREETANRTVILITHDPRAASLFTDRIVQMQAGRIVR